MLPRPQVWHNDVRSYKRVEQDIAWKDAADLTEDDYLAVPIRFPKLPVPAIEGREILRDEAFWWLVGRWLGDGTLRYQEPVRRGNPWQTPRLGTQPPGSSCIVCGRPARLDKRSKDGRTSPYCERYACKRKASQRRTGFISGEGRVFITCSKEQADSWLLMLKRVQGLGPWSRRDMRAAAMYGIHHIGLTRWLVEHFGANTWSKTIPAWALGMPQEYWRTLLEGYLSADGHQMPRMTTPSSVSPSLIIGIRLLAGSLGHCAIVRVNATRKKGIFEGRTVNMRPLYSVAWTRERSADRTPQAVVRGEHRWFKVKGVEPGNTSVRVYNLSVEEDESYVVDGLVVHSCKHLSTAKGGQPRDADSRMLSFELPRYAGVLRPRYVFVENVPDILIWGPLKDGRVDPDRKGELHRL